MTNKEVLRRYVDDTWSDWKNSDRSLFSFGGVLYSYGRHFPLAVPLLRQRTFLVNEERCSVTTSRHRSGLVSAATKAGLAVKMVSQEDLVQYCKENAERFPS